MFDASLTQDSNGKNFEFTGALFIPLPGEYQSNPSPDADIAPAVDMRPLFVPQSVGVHFQKNFDRKVKMNPLDGERIKTREKNSNRVVFRFGARVSESGEGS